MHKDTTKIYARLRFYPRYIYLRSRMGISIYQTRDKSHTLYNEELDETYHSRNGAVEESLYVFLKQGFGPKTGQQPLLNILEVGFGTGLNALLTLIEADKTATNCRYYSLETFPLPVATVSTLNYTEFVDPAYRSHFLRLHEASWNEPAAITAHFTLCKIHESIHTYKPAHTFDLVYFDAFAPDKQPDMWTSEVFDRLYEWMSAGGILVTYSAKGDVRRALKQAGFVVKRLPGPPFKWHMLRAVKP